MQAVLRNHAPIRHLQAFIVALAAVAFLIASTPAGAASLCSGPAAEGPAGAMANDSAMDCCDHHNVPHTTDCKPGMACHASSPALPGPELAVSSAYATRIDHRIDSDDLVLSRPPDGLLRPPRRF